MESTAEVESRDLLEVRSEGLGEKRPVENGEGVELGGPVAKKARIGGGVVGNIKKMAEIVLVLAAMGKMRGGRSPTMAEKEMIAEARTKLVGVCEGFAPKDLFPRDAFGTVIDDLGLNKLREQRLGFRPPKLSIAEKLLLTKQKMEKSENFSLHSGPHLSQRLQMNSGAATESCGTSHAVRMFPADKSNHAQISSAGVQGKNLGHVSAANSTGLPYQLPSSEVRPMVSSGLPSSHVVRDSSFALPRVEQTRFRLDGRSNGSSNILQAPGNSSSDHKMVKTPTWSVQPQSASSSKVVSDNKELAHTSIQVEGAADMNTSRMAPQATSKPFSTQTTSAKSPSMHQHLQGMNFVQAPSLGNRHNEISKIVQKLLHPHLPQHPTWTPPSRDYMNKALTCQICKQTFNDVDSVLVCDACEKGFHLKCLQLSNQKVVPRGEWHCGMCLTVSQGKPLPPKYGRVTRNINAPKLSSNTALIESSAEKKVGTLDEKASQQKITANGNPYLQSPLTVTNIISNPASGSKMVNVGEMLGNDTLSNRVQMDDNPSPETFPSNLTKSSGAACISPTGLSVQRTCVEELVPESSTRPPAKSKTVTYKSQAPSKAQDNDQTNLAKSAEIPFKQCSNDKHMMKDSEKSCGGENLNCNSNHEIKQHERGVAQANPVETSGTSTGTTDCDRSSLDGLHSVDWIGNILQVVDEKTYHQSFHVNGVEYKVQDYALCRSINGKVMPSKLQAMWEDSKTRSKWVMVNRCYFPDDLPEEVGCPPVPESNEVYESNHESTVMAGLIQGPCEVLPPRQFIKESERRTLLGMEANDGLQPLFLCKWFYDERKRLFRAVSS
ncbi:unnamed protein product [Ilex paraguariensis]|uniref:PHD finger protein n=1 Tax=Ilex paraguariensis TaxID=185542 RepID=A0ABC8T387_9AQUA